jgi:prephenate dehydratase
VESPDTALSFREIKETKRWDLWAIWWTLAAEVYWLDILAQWIETNKENYTRFFIVQKNSKFANTFYNKASLHLLLPHQVGSLVQILSVMAAYWINLTKIESLPIVWEPFHYRFYVDVIFSNIERYHQMLSAIRPLLKELDVLWEYLAYEEYKED